MEEIKIEQFIRMAQDCAVRINERLKTETDYKDYIIEDECCNLQRDVRKKIYQDLSIAFNEIIKEEQMKYIGQEYQYEILKNKLFKIINDL